MCLLHGAAGGRLALPAVTHESVLLHRTKPILGAHCPGVKVFLCIASSGGVAIRAEVSNAKKISGL
jgi:hypothetical protein